MTSKGTLQHPIARKMGKEGRIAARESSTRRGGIREKIGMTPPDIPKESSIGKKRDTNRDELQKNPRAPRKNAV